MLKPQGLKAGSGIPFAFMRRHCWLLSVMMVSRVFTGHGTTDNGMRTAKAVAPCMADEAQADPRLCNARLHRQRRECNAAHGLQWQVRQQGCRHAHSADEKIPRRKRAVAIQRRLVNEMSAAGVCDPPQTERYRGTEPQQQYKCALFQHGLVCCMAAGHLVCRGLQLLCARSFTLTD